MNGSSARSVETRMDLGRSSQTAMMMVLDVFSVRGASTESGVAPEMPRYLSASDAAAASRIGGMDGSSERKGGSNAACISYCYFV